MKIKSLLTAVAVAAISASASAAEYVVDMQGAHASINFKIKHLGYSWLHGRFNKFSGKFDWDKAKPEASKISIEIDTNSVDSNHAKRDVHLRSADFLEVKAFPKATFVSTSIKDLGNDKLEVKGDFTFRGVTKNITIDATKIGEGKDPWGGYRVGFQGTTTITMADYKVKGKLGPASTQVIIDLNVEGVRH
ncbi:YceI family protein [Pleionea sp. CnH1-48]|uniref:YceI family protein n=1 Tax=Pleionea sp. CnH1-48 TaxID=2954494 RepID=UPI002097AB4E|nr:YceI family protein [Pleionea sp. CnH1-48]MCO7225824.1 YceI family protein [Pleionea sp. CnH1-48]